MHICYNGITFTMMELVAFHHDAVLDDSKTDFLYDRVYIEGTAIINGQAEPRLLADPPMSYVARSSTPTTLRHEEAARTRPPGQDGPGQAQPDNSNDDIRQFGVFRDLKVETEKPYNANAFTPGFDPPGFGNEADKVISLDPLPNSPVLTERLIRGRLLEPRGQLFVFSGTGESPGQLLLQSPGWGRHCDVRNGPKPGAFEIMQVYGDGATFMVRWSCETFINEQYRSNKNDPLLSNRFRMRHIVSEDSFLTIQVQGQALFDVGKLLQFNNNPDVYRPQLMLPVPMGFVRGGIEVEGLEGMDGVVYSYIDRQMAINFPAGPYVKAASITAEHKQYIDCSGDPVAAGIQAFDAYLNRKWLLNQNKLEHLAAMGGKSASGRPRPPVV